MVRHGPMQGLLVITLGVTVALGGIPGVHASAGPAQTEAPAETERAETEPEDGDGEPEGGAEEAVEPEPEPEPGPPTERERAAAAFREGTKAYELGKYERALTKFEEAFALAPEPALLFNMGQAHWRWFNLDKDIEHLRKAKTLFENYDKRMRTREDYFPGETQAFIRALEIQIEAEEKKLAEANRPVIVGPSVEELEAAEKRKERRERALRTAERLNAAGIALIVVGSVTAAVALGGVVARQAYKLILDNTTGGGDANTPNRVSAEEDERRRGGYLTAGQVAYGSLIGAAIMLPVGIGLRVGGALIERRELGAPKKRDDKERPPTQAGVQAHIRPGALLTIEF